MYVIYEQLIYFLYFCCCLPECYCVPFSQLNFLVIITIRMLANIFYLPVQSNHCFLQFIKQFSGSDDVDAHNYARFIGFRIFFNELEYFLENGYFQSEGEGERQRAIGKVIAYGHAIGIILIEISISKIITKLKRKRNIPAGYFIVLY